MATNHHERGIHYIKDDLSETFIEDWAKAGVAEIEVYLGKVAAFEDFYAEREAAGTVDLLLYPEAFEEPLERTA